VLKLFLPVLLVVFASYSLTAQSQQPSINDMQGCQAVIEFVEQKLASPPEKYAKEQVNTVLTGLNTYNTYIQSEIVSPGLLTFNGGDQAKANAMQVQIDSYKDSLVSNLNARFPENRLYTDQAMTINQCAQKAVPTGEALNKLKEALQMMVVLAQMG